jgi:hypothetical protein
MRTRRENTGKKRWTLRGRRETTRRSPGNGIQTEVGNVT